MQHTLHTLHWHIFLFVFGLFARHVAVGSFLALVVLASSLPPLCFVVEKVCFRIFEPQLIAANYK